MICERLMGQDSEFERALKNYLEATHTGEFMSGSMEQVKKECEM